jgi:hypothetical protein
VVIVVINLDDLLDFAAVVHQHPRSSIEHFFKQPESGQEVLPWRTKTNLAGHLRNRKHYRCTPHRAVDQYSNESSSSDPLVFTQLLQEIGVQGLQVDDLYSLDPETLESLQPIHAFIFLFKWVAATDESQGVKDEEAVKRTGGQVVSAEESSDCGVFYANQVIGNSCGSVAVVNAVSPVTYYDHGGS